MDSSKRLVTVIKIVAYIKSLGFKQCTLDNHGKEIYMISLYVDDILIAGSNLSVIELIKHAFTIQYEMKNMG